MGGNIISKIINTVTTDKLIQHNFKDDRISELPDSVAHHILSFLVDYPAELIRTSVLSKRWFALTASSPILVFNKKVFTRAIYPLPSVGVPYDVPKYAKDNFFNYVGYMTSRFSQQQNVVSANTFKLSADLEDPAHASIIDRCLGLILKQGFQVLEIYNDGVPIFRDDQQPPPMYRLPDKLLSVSSLTSLRIGHCELPSSLMVDDDAVKFKSLKMLSLFRVCLNEEMIKRLTSGCPLLEKFNFFRCFGFKRLCVYGLHNLQIVEIYYTSELEAIDIQAPNLAHIDLVNMGARDIPPCVNLFSCQKLSMDFRGCFSKPLAVSLSNFPFLETLNLKLTHDYKNLKLSSHSLRTLGLDTHSDLKGIEIDTPNLLYFLYSCKRSTGHQKIRNAVESKTCMECHLDYDVDTSWYLKFRRLLDRTLRFKVLKLNIFPSLIDVEELKLLESSPFELEHIELYVSGARELSEYLLIMDVVLWCCRPRSLTFRSYSNLADLETRDLIVKFTYEKLLEQEDKGKTNIQIVFSTDKAFGSNYSLITFLKD